MVSFLFSHRVSASAPPRTSTHLSLSSRAQSCERKREMKKERKLLSRKAQPISSLSSNIDDATERIRDNNGTHRAVIRPRCPRRLNATVYHPVVLVGPPFSPGSHTGMPGCLRRIPRRNLRIHTQPGLRINALLPSTTRSCRASSLPAPLRFYLRARLCVRMYVRTCVFFLPSLFSFLSAFLTFLIR